jgi:Tol biopolymer transport system component
MDVLTGKTTGPLAEGNQTPDFEELNILTPGLTWSPDGNKIAISAEHSGFDVIYIFDLEEDERETLEFNLESIESVAWSNDGKYLAFVGQTSKQSDIYIYNFETKELTDLTNDIFSDSDPAWSQDDKAIFFVSDRGDFLDAGKIDKNFKISEHNYSQKDIYKLNIADREIIRITDLPFSDETSPKVEANGERLIFISDINGINNIYIKNLSSDDKSIEVTDIPIIPVTNSISGLYQLSLSKDSKKLVFSTLYESVFNLFMLDNPFEPKTQLDTLKPTLYISKLEEKRNVKIDEEIVKDSLITLTGEKEVNKYVPGIIEIQKKSNKTNLQMYFEIGDEWFYFYYLGASNSMQVRSSIEKFNDILKETPQKKRQLSSEKDLSSYSYRLASLSLKKRFLKNQNWISEEVDSE